MRIAADHLKRVAVTLVRSLGAGEEEARAVADNLVMADMRGISTHGVNYLMMITERIDRGVMVVPTVLTILGDGGAVTHLDGGNGLGQPAAVRGMRSAIEKARRHGVGLTLIRRTNNIGLLAYYSLMAATEGMIGFCMCNGAAAMAPWGGAEAFFGTNPFSVAAPGGREIPVVLDMSTSLVARGKIRRAIRMKQRIPPGWALDAKGAPTEDPEAALKGTLLPIGGAKGSGMAFFVDLICGLLSGSNYAREVKTFHTPEGPTGIGVTTLAIDVSRFMERERFAALVSEHIRSIRGSLRAADTARIYLPGEIEAERERESAERGVDVDDPVCQALDALLERKGLPLRLKQGEVRA